MLGGWLLKGQMCLGLQNRGRELYLLEAKAISSDRQQFVIQRADAGHLHVTLSVCKVWQHAGQAMPGIHSSFLCRRRTYLSGQPSVIYILTISNYSRKIG